MTLHPKFVFAYRFEDVTNTLKRLIPSCWKKSQLSHDTKHLWFVLKLRVLKCKIKLGWQIVADGTKMQFISRGNARVKQYICHKTTAGKYSPRTLWWLSATSFYAAVVFVRCMYRCQVFKSFRQLSHSTNADDIKFNVSWYSQHIKVMYSPVKVLILGSNSQKCMSRCWVN